MSSMAGGMPVQPPPVPSWLETFWPHLTAFLFALIAIALGAADHFVAHDSWGSGVDLSLIWAGLGSGGVVATAVVTTSR